jgi:ATP-dependent Clp protease ATP-binding subunit ClpA
MSEYSVIGSAQRLLTKPDGTPSNLIEQIRLHPFSVVLLDEIEKAAAEVFDALMTVFDEGYLLDPWGREINFRSAVIILTSNLGAQVTESIGFGENADNIHLREVQRFFRPEFFNRMDAVINFRHLSPIDIERIAQIDLDRIAQREGLAQRNIQLVCEPQLIAWLAQQGYDRRLGARPLLRTIESSVITPISRFLAENPQAKNQQLLLTRSDERVLLRAVAI